MSLSSQKKQLLIAQAHGLKPVIIIGNLGLTENVLLEIDRALYDHELIKIKLGRIDKTSKVGLCQTIVQKSGAECLKILGNIAIFYKASDKKM